jgi:hypothetical protein
MTMISAHGLHPFTIIASQTITEEKNLLQEAHKQ